MYLVKLTNNRILNLAACKAFQIHSDKHITVDEEEYRGDDAYLVLLGLHEVRRQQRLHSAAHEDPSLLAVA